ncbi:hypothetical protein [Rhodococcoides corynebacterioides]|uniref:hypothetical protein n=1 Tax=Rhodococcoides corynebacterioides TaxID=53972 RepID=UPI0008366325|nr:hypothetical protein [Rhodococcus corynebacterioides]
MRIARALTLALAAPLLVIGIGSVWHHLAGWDLTQAQAAVIAASISGPFLVVAAILAFNGQAATRLDERRKFARQLLFEKTKYTEELASAARLEADKHRRQVSFEMLGRAMSALIGLRTCYIDLDRLAEEFADRPAPKTATEQAARALVVEAKKGVENARAELTTVAAMMLLLDYETAYESLMAVNNNVGGRMAFAHASPITEREMREFARLFTDAINSLRGTYNSA